MFQVCWLIRVSWCFWIQRDNISFSSKECWEKESSNTFLALHDQVLQILGRQLISHFKTILLLMRFFYIYLIFELNKILQGNLWNLCSNETVVLIWSEVFNLLFGKHNNFTQHQAVYNIWLTLLWLMWSVFLGVHTYVCITISWNIEEKRLEVG